MGFTVISKAVQSVVLVFIMSVLGANAEELRRETVEVRSETGKHAFRVEVAEDAASRAKGLMFRTDLEPYEGMLFIFPYSVEQNFWMKNTPISLDILFIGSDYEVKSIAAHTTPYSLNVINSGAPAQYVLEILAGRSAELGIKPGDKIVRIPD